MVTLQVIFGQSIVISLFNQFLASVEAKCSLQRNNQSPVDPILNQFIYSQDIYLKMFQYCPPVRTYRYISTVASFMLVSSYR